VAKLNVYLLLEGEYEPIMVGIYSSFELAQEASKYCRDTMLVIEEWEINSKQYIHQWIKTSNEDWYLFR
jgi:hypothetical protein